MHSIKKTLWKAAWLVLLFSTGSFAQHLKVHLDWLPDAEFAGIFVAQEMGWYKEAGIEIELVPSGLDTMPSFQSHDLEIGIHSGQDLIRAVAKGVPIKAFAATYQISPICIITGRDGSVHRLAELKGKTVGVLAPTDYDTYRVMLGSEGLSLKDVRFRQLHTVDEIGLVKALKSHEVDALTAWEFNWTLSFPILHYNVRVFPGYEHGLHFYGIVYFANQEVLAKYHDVLTRFLEITNRGWRRAFQNVDQTAELIVSRYYPPEHYVAGSRPLTVKQQVMELRLARRFFLEGLTLDRLGWMSNWKWERSLRIAKKFGLVPRQSKIRPEDVFDDSILKASFKESR